MSEPNFISCLKWVQRGVAKPTPDKVQLSKEELVQVIKDTQDKLRISRENANDEAGQSSNNGDEFGLENYDEEDDIAAEALGIGELAELPTEADQNFQESDDSEAEDDIIKSDDNLLLVGRVVGDASVLEIHVYNEGEPSFYVHHEINLESYPLCFEWLNYEPNTSPGNYCAVGLMNTSIIEIWDLDIVNSVEPAFKLGKRGSVKKNRAHIGHTDAVAALAWNRNFDHIMASGSADKKIMLWDMESQTPSTVIETFEDVIQCLQWHSLEAQTLLAGACDKKAKIFDCRTPDSHQTWKLKGEAEKVIWNPLQPFVFFAGTNNGYLQCFDCRQGQLWSVEAHPSQEITGLSASNHCPGLLVTSSGGTDDTEGTVKTWDYAETEIVCVNEKSFSHLGNIRCMELNPDSPFVIAAGGDKKSDNMQPYDLRHIDAVKDRFESRALVQLVPENTNDENMS